MADVWSAAENEAITAVYFQMLRDEIEGRPYVKAHVRRHLIGGPLSKRSHGAIERKFQNISAILDEIDIPYVAGYKPLRNYQSDLREAVMNELDSRSVSH